MKRLLRTIIVLVMGFALGVIWSRSPYGDMLEPKPGDPSGVMVRNISYSNLELAGGEFGWFAGSLDVRNFRSDATSVLVTVNVYDGEQNVGQLHGQVTLKPDSESSVDLASSNEYVAYTDALVELLPLE